MLRLVLFLTQLYLAIGTQVPTVYWSMDKYQDQTLLPDIGDPDKFSCDLSQLRADRVSNVPGVNNSALSISKENVKIANGIGDEDCMRDPWVCQDGLSVSFWLNIDKYTYSRIQVVARTTTVTLSLPGFYIGGDKVDEKVLQFTVRTSTGALYHASIPRSLNLQQWTHTGFRWNKKGLEVFINGTVLEWNEYESPPSKKRINSIRPTRYYMMLGSSVGPQFRIDDLRIYYGYLSNETIANLFTSPFEQAEATTTTTTTQRNPTSTLATIATTTQKTSTNAQQTSNTKQTTSASITTTSSSSTKQPTTATKSTPSTSKTQSSGTSTTKPTPATTSTLGRTSTTVSSSTTMQHSAVTVTKKSITQSTTTTTKKVIFIDSDGAQRFYEETWFYVIVSVTIAALVGSCIGIYIYYCCCNEEKKEEKWEEEELQPMRA